MSSELKTLRIRPPVGGLDTASSPNYVDTSRAPRLVNFIPGRPGRITQRGAHKTAATVVPGSYNVYSGALMAPDAVGEAALVVMTTGASTKVGCYIAAGAGSVNTWNEAFDVLLARTNAVVGLSSYGINLNGSRTLIRWTTGMSAGSLVQLTNGPTFSVAVCTHLGRLWALAGVPPGGGTSSRTSLYWTDIGGAPTNTLAEWQDDVSGLVNQIVLEDPADPGTALGRVGRFMAIFRSNSIWLLTGDTSASFSTRRVLLGIGALANTPVQELSDGCVFFANDGIYLFDGSSATLLNASWRDDYQRYIRTRSSSPTLSISRLSADWIMVTTSQAEANPFCKVCHVPSRSWFDWTTHTTQQATGAPSIVGNGNDFAFGWDVATGFIPPGNSQQSPAVPDHAGLDGTKTTTAQWYSKVYELSAPIAKSQMKRVMVEYAYNVPSGTPSPGLQVALYDGAGTQLLAATSLTAQVGGTTVRQRQTIDCPSETSDVQVRVTHSDSNNVTVTDLEIYDVWIEYQVTRQK